MVQNHFLIVSIEDYRVKQVQAASSHKSMGCALLQSEWSSSFTWMAISLLNLLFTTSMAMRDRTGQHRWLRWDSMAWNYSSPLADSFSLCHSPRTISMAALR